MFIQIPATPYFTIPLKDQIVDLDGTVTLRCVADGIPSVVYTWLKNSNVLTMNTLSPENRARFTISNNVLTIRNVNTGDNGMYQCAAANLHGTRYSSAQLRVLSEYLGIYNHHCVINKKTIANGVMIFLT